VFERYTAEARRAIFFALHAALQDGRTTIDSEHLLLGLLFERGTRADAIFHLRDLFPDKIAKKTTGNQQIKAIPLADDVKRSLAYTAREADNLRHYWIDTDHLVLGVLADGENAENAAAAKLHAAGLHFDAARELVIENNRFRPWRRVPLWGRVSVWVASQFSPLWRAALPTPMGLALQIAFLLGIILAMVFVAR
jgi:ATP-dependent Clp protease ATP-binding subunit ClpA